MRYLLDGQDSERLSFRLLRKNDFTSWLPLFSTFEAEEYLGLRDLPTPEARCQKWLDIAFERYEQDRGGMNVLIDKSSHALIGQAGLLIQEVDGVEEMEVAYSILPQYWNMGYASEAAQKCRIYAFDHHFSESLISIIHIANIRSERVAVKNGMVLEKSTTFKQMPVNVFRIHAPREAGK